MNRRAWSPLRIVLIAGIIMLILTCVCVAFMLRTPGGGQVNALRAAAAPLGYSPELEIANVSRCWDVVSTCGVFLYYRTDLTQDELAARLPALGWKENLEQAVSGREIFAEINAFTPTDLTLDGVDPSLDPQWQADFDGRAWMLTDLHGRTWFIKHFSLREQAGNLAIDGRTLAQNIVAIQLRTR